MQGFRERERNCQGDTRALRIVVSKECRGGKEEVSAVSAIMATIGNRVTIFFIMQQRGVLFIG